MDFAALEAFVTVAEQGSFSRAAEALHLTQPAVSKRVAALEGELEARLFDRIGRKVNLTEAGDALLANARRILQELAESRRVIANLSTQVRGRLSLATSHHAGLHRLPPVLRIYTKQYPQVELDLHFMDSESACSAVEHGDLELAVVTLPADPSDKLKLTKLWDDPLDIVVAKEHPLAAKRRLSIAALAQFPAILPAVGTFTREIITHDYQ